MQILNLQLFLGIAYFWGWSQKDMTLLLMRLKKLRKEKKNIFFLINI